VIHALGGEQDLRRMGGLRRELPITYWTFLVGAMAIAGVPGLAGFFSKDEVLYQTYARGHTLLWIVGLVTSLLTATYMFRIVFLAFHGERREDHAAAHHPSHLHDAPPAMAFVLIVLALGSIVAGYAGFPRALGGSNRFERFLEPSFIVSEDTGGDVRGQADLEEAETATASLEAGLMAVSTVVAVGGIGLAFFFFLKNPRAADDMANRFAGLHRVLVNKYYVDEIYDATLVQPIRIVSEDGLWKGIDVRAIDGTVNRVGEMVVGSSEILRRLQTGSVRVSAASLFLGVVMILGYYLWR
jgi:NADH-quinone oxidoreductase subunit L